MFPMTSIAAALVLFLTSVMTVCVAAEGTTPRSLLNQAKGLPSDFEEHFFDVPLAVRVERDQQLVGEAMVVLSRDDRLTLINFTDHDNSPVTADERDRWAAYLKQGVALGGCATGCIEQLVAVHYNLEESLVSLLTENVERDADEPDYHSQPSEGSQGLMLTQQLNLNGGQGQDLGGRLGLEANASLGNWTQSMNMQLSRLGGPDDSTLYHAVYSLYGQRELDGHFLRLGYFTPNAEGLTRQLRSFGASPDTALGVMYGSSDTLAINNPKPSVYPIYVTANRQGSVEIYRNGLLVNTQAVAAGLQSLDTRPLPGGIYEVEVRLIEDGLVTSTTQELVYKPSNWRNHDERWRYNLFAGRETKLLSNWDEQSSGAMTAGAAVNYLLHPRLIVGLSGRQVRDHLQLGTSLDWSLANAVNLYANLYQTQEYGTGADLNLLYHYGSGSVAFNHTRSWLDTRNTYEILPDGTRIRHRSDFVGQTSNSSLSLNHRLDRSNSLNARLSHSQGNTQGTGLDVGWMQRARWLGSDGYWRLSLFDRPGSLSSGSQRNRGFDLTFNLALGGPSDHRHWAASLGSRTSREGERDHNAAVSYRRDLQNHVLQSVSATASADTYGVGLSGMASFDTRQLNGDGFVQRSSFNGDLTGGLNLSNTLAVGGGAMALTSLPQGQGAGMIVDVESDVDDVVIRADDQGGGSTRLRTGRNFIPITAYRNSSLSFDFEGNHAPAATIQPARSNYHLNRGAVDYRKVSVMKTVTILGRLLDAEGRPLRGYHVINHASRGVSEVDGFFSMEMNANSPTLEVRSGENVMCQFRLDPANASAESDVLMIGDLRCTPDTLATPGSNAGDATHAGIF